MEICHLMLRLERRSRVIEVECRGGLSLMGVVCEGLGSAFLKFG
jgi:hypothetical protein